MVVVPNVINDLQSDAQSTLSSYNLIGDFSDAPLGTCPATEAAGTVITETPAGGSTAPYGSTVDLTVCPGPLSY